MALRLRYTDVREWVHALDTVARQIPFATAKALNRTATDFQAGQLAHLEQVFEIRRPAFFRRAIKIKPFATKRSLFATVSVSPPGGDSRKDIITRHERGGVRRPQRGGRSLAVPVAARRGKKGNVPKRLRPRALQLGAEKRARGTATVFAYGPKRTFLFRRADGSGLIVRRKRRGRSGTFEGLEILYSLEPDVRITPVLLFHENARFYFSRKFLPNFAIEYRKAVETARL